MKLAIRSWAPLLCCLGVASCLGSPPDRSEVHGRGVVTEDQSAPEGVDVFERPQWRVGDRFIERRGNFELFAYQVESIDDSGITMRSEESGVLRVLDLDLGELRWQFSERSVEFDPVDKRLTWPLWVGKKWTSHYIKKREGDALPVLARYHCDAVEEVNVPAGTFAALRVWCHSRPAIEGNFAERVDVFWYAPELGHVVRKLQDALMTELVSFERADSGD